MGAPIGGRSQLFQKSLAFLAVLGGAVASISATTTTTTSPRDVSRRVLWPRSASPSNTPTLNQNCIERAERAEATVRELRAHVQTLQGTVERLTTNIKAHVPEASLQNHLLELVSSTQQRDRRFGNDGDDDDNNSPFGCRDYSGSGVCPMCGGTFDPCVPGSSCFSEINTTCTVLNSVGNNQTGFEYGWSSVHTVAECAAAVVCIDCSGRSSATIDRVPCPPDGYTGANTSRVLLLLDNTRNLNLSSAFGANTRYPRYMAGLSLSNATIDGSLLEMYFMRIGGNVNLSRTTVVNGLPRVNFYESTVYGDIDLSGADISRGISTSAFYDVTVYGSIDLSGANVSGGISSWGFARATVDGNIDMSGADVSGGISYFAFAFASVGNISLVRADLSRGGLQPGVFLGATVLGVLNASGARFPNSTLPIQMLYGLNAQGGLDFSRCNLVSLSTRLCDSAVGCQGGLDGASKIGFVSPSLLEDLEGGPFTGMSMPVGIETVAVDLSQNQLTKITRSSLLGVTATAVNLSGNLNLSVFHPFWYESVANARVIDTTGNPTRCHRLNASGTPSAAFTFAETATTKCICGSGTAGTGNFCTAQPCKQRSPRSMPTLPPRSAEPISQCTEVRAQYHFLRMPRSHARRESTQTTRQRSTQSVSVGRSHFRPISAWATHSSRRVRSQGSCSERCLRLWLSAIACLCGHCSGSAGTCLTRCRTR
eukprot:m.407427 g.407427  ORF g.407427 m.407427 type:complete len:710 (-) comp28444_c1_seq12:1186-3315(-)